MSDLHGRPTAEELVEAVAEFLRDKLLPDLPAQHAFQLRVAINALGMVQRELHAGDCARARPLGRLGWADDARLAAAIRAGTLADSQRDEVRAALLADVEARLAVANPRYIIDYEPDDFQGVRR